ncbi:MAG: DUF4157 domain-containing protein [Deltaproteobacteria bacterium]|nr:DUF4157 domain-containing protein [Deltaproteobacteria bacterium]
MRRARDGNGVAPDADVAVARAATSTGAPLPDGVRAQFEDSLGADLSAVRIHTGPDSAAAAAAVGARAYTVGSDIHFADGNYAPVDPFGIHLLAHEVAHTQQQAGGAPHRQNKLEVSAPGDACEVEADRAADAMVHGAPATLPSGRANARTVARKESKLSDGDQARLKGIDARMTAAGAAASTSAVSINGISDGALATMQEASAQLSGAAASYKAAYAMVKTQLAAADGQFALQEAVKEAVVDSIMGIAFGSLLGPMQAEIKVATEAVDSAAKASKSKIAGLGLAALTHGMEAGGDKVGDVPGAIAGADKGKAVAPSGSIGGAGEDSGARFEAALQSLAAIVGALPRLGGAASAATMTASAAAELGTQARHLLDGEPGQFTTDQVAQKATTVESCAGAAQSSVAGARGAAQKVNSLSSQITSKPAKSAEALEDELWRNWMASLTTPQLHELLTLGSLKRYLVGRGLLGEDQEPDNAVIEAQKSFIKAHGVTPPSDDPDILNSLYKREVKCDEIKRRVSGKRGPLISANTVQIDGVNWRYDKNDIAEVGDILECVWVMPITQNTSALIAEWRDDQFSLMCNNVVRRPSPLDCPPPETGPDTRHSSTNPALDESPQPQSENNLPPSDPLAELPQSKWDPDAPPAE